MSEPLILKTKKRRFLFFCFVFYIDTGNSEYERRGGFIFVLRKQRPCDVTFQGRDDRNETGRGTKKKKKDKNTVEQ